MSIFILVIVLLFIGHSLYSTNFKLENVLGYIQFNFERKQFI